MFALLRQRNFGLLWFAGAASLLGDWALVVALPFFVYDLTGSALATGLTFMAQTLPRVLLGSVAGVFVDRWDRRKTLVVADATRGLLLLLLLLVRSTDTLWLVYLVAMAQAAIGQFFMPAKGALLPRLVGEDELVPANALNFLSDNLTRLVGPALGGALYGAVGLPLIVAIDAVSFLVSSLLLALIALPAVAQGARATQDVARGAAAVWSEWLAGLRIVAHNRLLAVLFIGMGLTMIAEGIFVSLLIPFMSRELGGGATQLGWLMSAQAVGGIAGGLLIGQVGKYLSSVRLIVLSGLLNGLLLLGIVNVGSLSLALILMAVAGVSIVGLFVSMQTIMQQQTEDRYRGRVLGAFGAAAAMMTLVGMGFAGLLSGPLGLSMTMSLGAILYLLAGLVGLALRPAASPAIQPLAEGLGSIASGD